jgi:hypothetical protein
MADAKQVSDRAGGAPLGGAAEQSLHDLARGWSAASDRAFATAMTDPESYVRTARLTAAVTAALRARGRGAAPLLAAWSDRAELIAELVASQDLLTTAGLDLEVVAGAAFAMRYREVTVELVHDRRLAVLANLPPDAGWTMLEESGYFPGDPFVPYRRLEVDPTTGGGILVTTRADEQFAACIHAVEAVHLDRATGELQAPPGGDTSDAPEEFATAEQREQQVARIKARAHPDRAAEDPS